MNRPLTLFRNEALHSVRTAAESRIVLIRPISFTYLTTVALVIACAIVAFFVWGSYTKRSTLNGQLAPDLGLLKVYAPQFGTIVEKHVTEGAAVKEGDVLFVLTSERRSSALGDMHAMVSQQVESRRDNLLDAIQQVKRMAEGESEAARSKLMSLHNEFTKVSELLAGVRGRVVLSEQTMERHRDLRKQGFLSQEDVLAKEADFLDQRTRLQTLERDRINLKRQIDEQQSTLNELPLRYRIQVAELERSIASTEQELSQTEASRKWVIAAPHSGTASSVTGEVGQTADASRPLLSIIPQGATLQAQLYAPSRAVGFVKPHDKVYLRYQAYPYQKFGHYEGVVESISQATASTTELTGTSAIYASATNGSNSEPVYRINVTLNSQSVVAYGSAQPLHAGMLVEADVLQDSRHIYEWVLEPLITLTGKVRR